MFSLKSLTAVQGRALDEGRAVGLYARLSGRQANVDSGRATWRRIGSVRVVNHEPIVVLDEVWPHVQASLGACLTQPAAGWPRLELACRDGATFHAVGDAPLPPTSARERPVKDPWTGGPSPVRSRWPAR